MLIQLGPVDSEQIDGWIRFARRVLCDLRTEPGDLENSFSQNTFTEWNRLIDQWSHTLSASGPGSDGGFIWRGELEPDKAEYLLHSWQRALHSATAAAWITSDDMANHGAVTIHVMQCLIDSLESEGEAHVEYVDQLRSEVARFRAWLAG